MTKKGAFLSAVRRETPDVVPVSPLIHHRYARRRLGRWDWKAVFELHQQLGSTHYRGPLGAEVGSELPAGFQSRGEVVRQRGIHRITCHMLTTPRGSVTQTREVGYIPHDPLVAKTTEYYVKEPNDWRVFIEYWNAWADHAVIPEQKRLAEAHEVMGQDGVASCGVGSAFTKAASAREMLDFMYDLYDCPGLVREALCAAWRHEEWVLEAFIPSPSEICFYDSCWATGMNLGPVLLEQWLGSEIRQACEIVRHAGKYISFYTLGKMREILPILVDAGPHMIATFEPNEGDISLGEVRKLYGDRICVMGNLDCVILVFGGIQDARAEAVRCLNEAKGRGGYVLGTADEAPVDAKWDNLRAIVDTVGDRGRY